MKEEEKGAHSAQKCLQNHYAPREQEDSIATKKQKE